MSGSMFSVGRDCQVVVLGAYGRVDLVHVTGFESRQTDRLGPGGPDRWPAARGRVAEGLGRHLRSRARQLRSRRLHRAVGAAFYNGQSPSPGTLYQYISESDGSTSTFQFNNVVFRLASAGLWKGDASVKQKLEFFASTRVRM